ncbi:MAG: ABC transporter substrate-binding protein [Comamonadaceae bacterium]|nr:MAG: ABC transporter substrate-binding protein [Comamonadaceae bacterium]
MFNRRTLIASAAAASLLPHALPALAQSRGKDSVVIGLTLEPAGLDPTAKAGAEISEVVLYNVFETLTKIQSDGSVKPLLAESWEVSPDLKTYTFKLRRGVKFHNGVDFDAQTVKYSFERAVADKSTNKDRRLFSGFTVQVVDAHTVVLLRKEVEPNFLFQLGQASAILIEPSSAETNASKPVGTGPYTLGSWSKGSSLTLDKWPAWRDASKVALRRVTFRFVSEPAAQTTALLAGDIDVIPHASVSRSLPQFERDKRFQILFNNSLGKTILAINNKKAPLNDVRVRRAIAAAIDRDAVIAAAADGRGVAIGSHYVPGLPGYVDTTGINPFDIEKARRLLAEAGVKTPLELDFVVPPPPYARQGSELIAAQLAKIGIVAKIQNVEWAQWLSGTYGNKNYDLTLILHVEPFDLDNFAKPDYYWGYQSPRFNELFEKARSSPREADRLRYLGDAQRLLAEDAVHAWLFQPQLITVARRGLRGLWKDLPIFANDLAALSWA